MGQPSANCCILMGGSVGSMKEYMREHYDDGVEGDDGEEGATGEILSKTF